PFKNENNNKNEFIEKTPRKNQMTYQDTILEFIENYLIRIVSRKREMHCHINSFLVTPDQLRMLSLQSQQQMTVHYMDTALPTIDRKML
ncbi:MAG TPA: hypothetical protein VI033_07275, partial [Candidatus Nitrosopolaris sp.]